MNKTFTAKYFIAKFERIPASRWGTGSFKRGKRKCALGHCGMRVVKGEEFATAESDALSKLFRDNKLPGVPEINDTHSLGNFSNDIHIGGGEYRSVRVLGDNAKERVINALVLIETGLLRETEANS